MNWLLEPLDLYCERIDTSLWAEPWNFASNLAFFLAAARIMHLRLTVKSPSHRHELKRLAFLAALIGAGSALFHSWATRLSQVADIVPIALFVCVSLYLYIRNLRIEGCALARPLTVAGLALTLPALMAFGLGWGHFLAKGESYLGIAPSLIALAAFEGLKERRMRLYGAAGLFILAYIFRTLDMPLCEVFPHGTHFLWHLLATTTAYMMASIQAVTGRRVREGKLGGPVNGG
jgi:hypothetical protein